VVRRGCLGRHTATFKAIPATATAAAVTVAAHAACECPIEPAGHHDVHGRRAARACVEGAKVARVEHPAGGPRGRASLATQGGLAQGVQCEAFEAARVSVT
jgi:ribosomal protein L2